MQPDYTILLDCGLIPSETAVYNFFSAMEADKDIGGVCGFMGLKEENAYDDSGLRGIFN
jgi:chitin synthase